MLTGCSGTDAPIHTLMKLMPHNCFVQVANIDIDEAAQTFMQAHFNPLHNYMDIAALNNSAHTCLKHGCCCDYDGPFSNIDLAVFGFPCKPFSPQNLAHFCRDPETKFEDVDARPFFEISKWIESQMPAAVILENVKAIEYEYSESISEYKTPMDFIMNGTRRAFDGSIEKIGLSHIAEYHWSHYNVKAELFGLPHQRERVFIVGIRRDMGKNGAVERMDAMIRQMSASNEQFLGGQLSDFLIDDEVAIKALTEGWGPAKSAPAKLTAKAAKHFAEYRFINDLPNREAPNGRPISKKAAQEVKDVMGARSLEMADIIACMDIKDRQEQETIVRVPSVKLDVRAPPNAARAHRAPNVLGLHSALSQIGRG